VKAPDGDGPLTPEESARKFDILEAIDAIPVKDMPGALKPLARRLMSRSGYGQGVCYASYNTLARETGLSRSMGRLQLADLLGLKWFVFAGRQHSESKHAKPEFKVAPCMVDYLRSYFAGLPVGVSKVATRTGNQVATRTGNKPVLSTGLKNRVDKPESRSGRRAARSRSSGPTQEEDGGNQTTPIVPAKLNESEYRAWVHTQIDKGIGSGDSLSVVKANILRYASRHGRNRQTWAQEEIDKAFSEKAS